jgi:hypothetical protein
MTETSEKRGHARVARDERVLVKILSTSHDSSLHDAVAKSRVADLSVSGVRVCLDESLPPGTTVDLWIKVEALPGTFLLQGQVKWSDQAPEGAFYSGIELGGDAPDLEKWQEAIAAEIARAGS